MEIKKKPRKSNKNKSNILDINTGAKASSSKYNLSEENELSDKQNSQLIKIDQEGFQKAPHKESCSCWTRFDCLSDREDKNKTMEVDNFSTDVGEDETKKNTNQTSKRRNAKSAKDYA